MDHPPAATRRSFGTVLPMPPRSPAGAAPGPTVEGSGGARVVTWDLGGEGPPLVILHATGFHGRCYLPMAQAMRDRFHCWAVDQRGHGASDPAPDGDYSWSHFTADALTVVEALDLERPFVFGHSLGGAVAMLAEAARPGTWSAMFLWEPIVLTPTLRRAIGRNTHMATLARRRRPRFGSSADALANYAGKLPFSLFRADALLQYVEGGFSPVAGGEVALRCSPEAEALVYEGAPDSGAYEAAPSVMAPTVLAGGGRDADIDSAHLEALAAALGAGATIETYPRLGHLGPFEEPFAAADGVAPALEAAALSRSATGAPPSA